MADQDFNQQWLAAADEYSAPLEDWQKVPVISKEEDYNEMMSIPGVKYSADPTLTSNAKPLNFVQLHLGTLFHRINNMEDGLVTAKENAETATSNANTAAGRADESREAIERNEATRQTNEATRQTNEAARESAEATRQQTFVSGEQARQTTFNTNEAQRQSTFETNETQRQQDFEDAESDRMAAILMTEFFVDPQTMHLMVVQPKNDLTDYNVIDGYLMVTFQYDDGL